MSTRFLSSLYFKGSLGFLIHRFQASKCLLAVHTQTLFIFWAKGIPFIHDGSIKPIRKSNHISISSHCKLKHKNNLNPTCCVLFYGCIINSIMLDLTKTRQEVMLLLRCKSHPLQCIFFLRPKFHGYTRQQLKPAGCCNGYCMVAKRVQDMHTKNGQRFKTNSSVPWI